jgi:hypothetical protein
LKALKFTLFSIVFILQSGLSGFSQTKVTGTVYREDDGSTIPFANVFFTGTGIGTTTDIDGNYEITSKSKFDSLTVSVIGYRKNTQKVKPGTTQTINFTMSIDNTRLSEVVIKAGENPAFAILRKAIQNREYNDPDYANTYFYQAYNKIQFDLNNIPEKFKTTIFLKPYRFVWRYLDSTEDGREYLPMLLAETFSEVYHRRSPKAKREYVLGNKISGIENEGISELLNDQGLNPNIYEDFVIIFNKSFPGILNPNLNRYYRYYLEDTLFRKNNNEYYRISFMPKVSGDIAFSGEMLIERESYGIAEIDLQFSESANINFVRFFKIFRQFEKFENERWFNTESKVFADFTVFDSAKKMIGFFGRKSTIYQNIKVNVEIDPVKFEPIDNIIMTDQSLKQEDTFWEKIRPEPLNKQEQGIYNMIDTINNTQKFKNIKNAFFMFSSGYFRYKGFDFGDLFSMYSQNNVEGHRVKIALKTNRNLTPRLRAQSYIAYGMNDQRPKFFLNAMYFTKSHVRPRHNVGLYYKRDIEQISLSNNALPIDNLGSWLFRTAPFNRLTFVNDARVYYEHNWFMGFVTRLGVGHRIMTPQGDFSFDRLLPDGSIQRDRDVNIAEIRFNTRFAFREKSISGDFNRRVFTSKYPSLATEVLVGVKDILGSDFSYQKITAKIDHRLRINPYGYIDYSLEGGQIFGNVPYTLLEVHRGNQTLINDEISFNMMNFFEFISDRYFSVMAEYHTRGYILNRIPLIKKLKLREFFVGKALYGGLSDMNNQKPYIFPQGSQILSVPYYEAGFGLENIFKICRIDFLWRLSYLDQPNVQRFAIKGSVYLSL